MINSNNSVLKVSLLSLFLLTACGGGGGGANGTGSTTGSTDNGGTTNSDSNKNINFLSVVSFLERTISNDFKSFSNAPVYTFHVYGDTPNAFGWRRIKECETGTSIVYEDSVTTNSSNVTIKKFVAEYTDFYGAINDDVNTADCSDYSHEIKDFVHGRIDYTRKSWRDGSSGEFHTSSNVIYGDSANYKVDAKPYFSSDDPTSALQGSLYQLHYGFSPKVTQVKAPYLKYYTAYKRKFSDNEQLVDRSKFVKYTIKYGEFRDFDVVLTDNHYKGSYTKETYELDRNKAAYLSDNLDDFIKVSLKLTFDLDYRPRYGEGKVNFEITFNPEIGVSKAVHGYIDYNGREKTIYTIKNGVTKREYGSRVN